jgi:hypothetical protein
LTAPAAIARRRAPSFATTDDEPRNARTPLAASYSTQPNEKVSVR